MHRQGCIPLDPGWVGGGVVGLCGCLGWVGEGCYGVSVVIGVDGGLDGVARGVLRSFG